LTEIPEHLLERSRARRAALGLGGDDAGAPAAAPAAESGGASAPATTSAAPAKAAAAPAPVAKAPEIVLSPYAQAAVARKKIPFWAVPVLIFLPLWGFLYWGTLDPEPVEATGLAAEGDAVYGTSCASCHGAAGGGGVGPELTGVTQTFPDYESHVWWIVNGSRAVPAGAPYGSPDREGGQRQSIGGMPPWGEALSSVELLAAVYHERQLSGATIEELAVLEAIAENPELPANFTEGSSLDEIRALLAGLVPEELVAAAAAAE
jgi:mono/diheme cytochrome c family protein